MAERISSVKVSVGFASETGPRKRNEDFAGAVFGPELPEPRRDLVAAIADGIGSTKGGREAAEGHEVEAFSQQAHYNKSEKHGHRNDQTRDD